MSAQARQLPEPGADARLHALRAWLAAAPGGVVADPESVRAVSGDASFRRYFRVDAKHPTSAIVMDAPPDKEDIAPFLRVCALLRAGGIGAPEIYAADAAQGFVLLADFGDTTYLQALNEARASGDGRGADALMRRAGAALVRLQGIDAASLPRYDETLLRRELDLFPQWYVARHLGVELDADSRQVLQRGFDALVANNLAQPTVLVHRDWHSRNLMVRGNGEVGVLDFQDAVHGPLSYDLVSMLRDAYIDWPEEQQIDWAVRYWEAARAAALPVPADFADFYRDFEWMGLQRQLKVLGIFARLHHRDGKDQYLADMPRVWAYARATAARYVALTPLARLLDRLQGVRAQAAYTF
ncbi:phosphotransferase enzyme family protein [mine drainage metagenome]|jgi:aminoglycoside/choline kinase family phosphotransferase|uniref:Phosphotransferase enzyme family protein n=1 Tax=mine drainage metagenome TaxID=410659 RepID=A0A1J5QJK4_9ZZZZ